ncbi:MAG: aminopeptidase P N-terminal domain-containing protein [Saprospiraceae bacterium]|nr:aminopeptidase P N-terminal domain-containing protein [Saprospiraceae bacterium]
MRYKQINSNFFIKNREKLTKKLKDNSLAILNANDEMPRNGDQFFKFRQNSDLFYLTGLEQEKCILCICPNHPNESYREILFSLKPNEELEIWYGHKYTKEEITEISGIKTVMWLDEFDEIFEELITFSSNIYLNKIEYPKFSTDVPYRDIRFAKDIRAKYRYKKFKALAPLLTELRLIKEAEEIELMQNACDITEKAFRRTLNFVKPGKMEYQVEAEITHEFISNAANAHAYAPIIASGINACTLHYIENDKECKDGDLLLMDFGAEYANYAADCSRTIPVNGKFSERQKDCYNAVLRVFNKAKTLFVPGNTIDNINNEVNQLIEKEMIALGLFNEEDVKNQDEEKPMYFKYLMHGISHFIGLDVHDVGAKSTELQKGMILTCEPGLYIKEEGIGIRIENDILVDDVPVDLMKNIPVEVEEIEELMRI